MARERVNVNQLRLRRALSRHSFFSCGEFRIAFSIAFHLAFVSSRRSSDPSSSQRRRVPSASSGNFPVAQRPAPASLTAHPGSFVCAQSRNLQPSRQRLDIVEALGKRFLRRPKLHFAKSRKIDQQPSTRHLEHLPAGGRVPATVVVRPCLLRKLPLRRRSADSGSSISPRPKNPAMLQSLRWREMSESHRAPRHTVRSVPPPALRDPSAASFFTTSAISMPLPSARSDLFSRTTGRAPLCFATTRYRSNRRSL